MNTNWLIVAATAAEIQPFTAYLSEKATRLDEMHYVFGDKNITILITGVGLTQTAYHLGAVLARQSFEWAINAGIAGAIKRSLALGEVVEVSSEIFGDTGAETATGSFIDIHEMGLIPPDMPPFLRGELLNPNAGATGLPQVKGLSVNKVHGYLPSITEMMIHYDADIETMEGAAFFYACLSASQPFMQIRSLSNYVEPRDRSKWNIPFAVQALNTKLIELIQQAKL